MRFKSIEEFKNYINSVAFNRLEDINVGEMLGDLYFFHDFDNVSIKDNFRHLLSILRKKYAFSSKEKTGTFVLFSHYYSSRQDIFGLLNNVCQCSDYPVKIVSTKGIFPTKTKIRSLKLIFDWLRAFCPLELSPGFKFYLSVELFQAYCSGEEVLAFLKKNNVKPDVVVSFCDFHASDYYLIQRLNMINIPTATLQHGVFSHLYAYAFEFSHSTAFLAMNQHTLDEISASDLTHPINTIVTGPVKYIDCTLSKTLHRQRNNVIGIGLNGVTDNIDNKELLDLAASICKEYDSKMIVRPHPSYSKKMIEELLKGIENYSLDLEMSLVQFGKECDFVLTTTSSVFADFIIGGIPVFCYTKNTDLYPQIDEMKFHDLKELRVLVEQLYSGDKSLEEDFTRLWDYFCPDTDVKNRYHDFFSSMHRKGLGHEAKSE